MYNTIFVMSQNNHVDTGSGFDQILNSVLFMIDETKLMVSVHLPYSVNHA